MKYLSCDDTYEDGEWCWFTDSCSVVINDYSVKYTYDPNPRDSVQDPDPEDAKCDSMAEWGDLE
ncbi:MAG: hypothetical protein IKE24_02470 [Clostridia bacterium]|nr:hypothetical protein [Clostridia bacterium]